MDLLSQQVFYLNDAPVTVGQLVWALVFLAGGAIIGTWAAFVVGRRILWPGGRIAQTGRVILTVLRLAFFAAGVLAAASALGYDVMNLVWIILGLGAIAALTLRDAARELCSGLFLLWERPYEPGEYISIGAHEGEVESIGLRATDLRSEDRLLVRVPHSCATGQAVTNWSKTEGGIRVRIPLVVPPGNDSNAVINALRKVAERNSRVRKSPSPKAFLTGFSERGNTFELLVWVSNHTERPWVTNELCRAIESDFPREGITFVGGAPGAGTHSGDRAGRTRTRSSERTRSPRGRTDRRPSGDDRPLFEGPPRMDRESEHEMDASADDFEPMEAEGNGTPAEQDRPTTETYPVPDSTGTREVTLPDGDGGAEPAAEGEDDSAGKQSSSPPPAGYGRSKRRVLRK